MGAGLKDEEFRRLVNLGRRSSRVTMIVTVYERKTDREVMWRERIFWHMG